MHNYHPASSNYDEKQILFDSCGECQRRSKNVALAIREMDGSTFERAWKRAYDLESSRGNRDAIGIVSDAERPVLEALWAIQIEFERRGMVLDGTVPAITHEAEAIEEIPLPGPYRIDPLTGGHYRESHKAEDGWITITDCFGSHEGTVLASTFESWEQA